MKHRSSVVVVAALCAAASVATIAGQDSAPIRPGPGVTAPRPIYEPRPNYTHAAMEAGIQGIAAMDCTVEADGSVRSARITRSLDAVYGLDDEAVATVKKWRFQPGRYKGSPVPVVVNIELSFTLRPETTPHLSWPYGFVAAFDGRDQPWTATEIRSGTLRIHVEHPSDWNVRNGAGPTDVADITKRGSLASLRLQIEPGKRTIERPFTDEQLRSLAEQMINTARVNDVRAYTWTFGQLRTGDRLWVWHEWTIPSTDVVSKPVDAQTITNGLPGASRGWTLETTASKQLIKITFVFVTDEAGDDADTQRRRFAAEFGEILRRIKIHS